MKERMTLRSSYAGPLSVYVRTADRQLVLQMEPLVRKLTRTDRNLLHGANHANLGAVEAVASTRGLRVNRGQVRVDGQTWMRMRTETLKLRVVLVTTRFAANHSLGQQSFSPQSNQTLWV